MEVALLERAVLERQPLAHDLARTPERCALDLRLGIERIDHSARIHGDCEPFDLVLTVFGIDRNLLNAANPGRALPPLVGEDVKAHSVLPRDLLRPPATPSPSPP